MKVLVLSVTAGQGHNATAKALCAYLEVSDARLLCLTLSNI